MKDLEHLGNALMVLGLLFFVAATGAAISDKHFGTAIKQTTYQIGTTK